MRLIDAGTLRISAIKATDNSELAFDNCYPYWQFSECIKKAPTIDAVPVVRGEWEVAIGYDPNKKVQCQNCYKMAYEPTAYCPNCGAKMAAEKEAGHENT